jgi:hypothetical protein
MYSYSLTLMELSFGFRIPCVEIKGLTSSIFFQLYTRTLFRILGEFRQKVQ